mgnify:CR=1 FL=1
MSTTGTLHRPPRHPGLILGLLALSQVGVAWLWWRSGWTVGLPAMMATHLLVVWATLYPRATVFCPALSRLRCAMGFRLHWSTRVSRRKAMRNVVAFGAYFAMFWPDFRLSMRKITPPLIVWLIWGRPWSGCLDR